MSVCAITYCDNRGRLVVDRPSNSSRRAKRNVICLSAYNLCMNPNKYGRFEELISLRLNFGCGHLQQSLFAICTALKRCPVLQTLCVNGLYTGHGLCISSKEFFEALKELPYTQVKNLAITYYHPHDKDKYGTWLKNTGDFTIADIQKHTAIVFSKIESLHTNVEMDFRGSSLPSLRYLSLAAWDIDDQNIWMPQLHTIILSGNCLGMSEIYGWFSFILNLSRTIKWQKCRFAFLDKQKIPSNLFQQAFYQEYYVPLLKNFKNLLACNRHIYRTMISRVLLEAANRSWPSLGNSISHLFLTIFQLLSLA